MEASILRRETYDRPILSPQPSAGRPLRPLLSVEAWSLYYRYVARNTGVIFLSLDVRAEKDMSISLSACHLPRF